MYTITYKSRFRKIDTGSEIIYRIEDCDTAFEVFKEKIKWNVEHITQVNADSEFTLTSPNGMLLKKVTIKTEVTI